MFTSRLPVSTSVRRNHSHADGGGTSVSFVGANRQSNIPVTVRKTNLFTPQTKRPFSTGASTAGKSYMSGMTTDKKYQRPLKPVPDREQQMRMFTNLIEYIRLNGPHLPVPEAKKFFSSVSTTESSRIFEFLIGRLLPDFKISRLETDVPEALAMLDYPYIRSVTKSALVSVTTRQAVVGLLVIFDWLIGSIMEYESPKQDNLKLSGGEAVDERELAFNLVRTQPEQKLTEAMRRTFECLYSTVDSETVRRELEGVEEEMVELQQYLDEVDELKPEGQNLEEDIEKCEEYNSQMRKYLKLKIDELNNQKQESLRLKICHEEKCLRLEHINSTIENHELKIEEVKKDKAVIDQLETKLSMAQDKKNTMRNEQEQIERKDAEVLEKFTTIRDANLIKALLQTYESQEVQSELWSKRRVELREIVRKLEQVPPKDLNSNQKLQHEQRLFLQKLRATNPMLESEVIESMTTMKEELQRLELSINTYEKDTVPNLKKAIERVSAETEKHVLASLDNMSRWNNQVKEENLRAELMKESSEHMIDKLSKELELEIQRTRGDLVDSAEVSELDEKHLKSVLEFNRRQVMSLARQAKWKEENWDKARLNTENNLKAAQRAFKLVNRRLKL